MIWSDDDGMRDWRKAPHGLSGEPSRYHVGLLSSDVVTILSFLDANSLSKLKMKMLVAVEERGRKPKLCVDRKHSSIIFLDSCQHAFKSAEEPVRRFDPIYTILSVMASTGTRLRKTFKYPSDKETSDDSRDELDEEGKHMFS